MATAEERRRQNLEDNKRVLAEIGLINPFKALPRVSLKKGVKRKAEPLARKTKRPFLEENLNTEQFGSRRGERRRSARILGQPSPNLEELKLSIEADGEEDDTPKKYVKRPHSYGLIEGVEVGMSWLTRVECGRDGIHRPTVAGIHAGPEGAYSIALSGGYDDNIDLGECFTYTGEGGRDLKGTASNPKNLRTAAQTKDQTLSRGNLALKTSVETGKPVRVIRGYKLASVFAPDEGYRYDGLYTVEKAWYTVGLAGFGVWKFALRRCDNQAPPPWTLTELKDGSPSKDGNNNTRAEKSDHTDTEGHMEEESKEVEKKSSDAVQTPGASPVKDLDNTVEDHASMIKGKSKLDNSAENRALPIETANKDGIQSDPVEAENHSDPVKSENQSDPEEDGNQSNSPEAEEQTDPSCDKENNPAVGSTV